MRAGFFFIEKAALPVTMGQTGVPLTSGLGLAILMRWD